ncbi:hypothetical protein D5F01_LYC20795 [Larimichthys crocea]|uniref:Uncharacterized protein n=1 Tax=Larimichthys crocea TaxID=215358 RepID=A0A6G0HMI1_LARCR|nr:hypothetical protein D5F01_LYC20795 [Larimichthys crocea]
MTGLYRTQRGQVAEFSDETKIGVELLWSHLVLVYAGNHRLLLCNVELFFLRRQDSLNLCPSELRAALFSVLRGQWTRPKSTGFKREKVPRSVARSRPTAPQSCGPWTLSATGASFTGCTNPNRREVDGDVIGRTEPGRGGLVGSSAYVATTSAHVTNETLRDTGSCVVELDNNVFLHVLHVNTVGNQKFNVTIFSKRHRRYGRVQSNTTKTKLSSRLRFVSDKKRLRSQHGCKNTRIEFSSNPNHSANYTSNAKYLL